MEAVLAIFLIGALFVVPLGLAAARDRKRERAAAIRADLLRAVNRRLHGESLIAIEVTPGTRWRRGRVVLSAPRGSEDLVEAVWPTVTRRLPPGWEVVITTGAGAPPRADQEARRAA